MYDPMRAYSAEERLDMHGKTIPATMEHEMLLPHEVVASLYASGLMHLLTGDADESCLMNDVS